MLRSNDPLLVADLVDLAYGDLENGEERLEKRYSWEHERGLAKSREAFAAAALILTPLLAATFDPKAHVESWQAALYLAGAAASFLGGAVWLHRLRSVEHAHLAAIRAYGLLRRAFRGV